MSADFFVRLGGEGGMGGDARCFGLVGLVGAIAGGIWLMVIVRRDW